MYRTATLIQLPNGVEFEPEGPGPHGYASAILDDPLWITELTNDSDGADYRVTWLVHDEAAEDFEWADPDREPDPKQWVRGAFRDFRNGYHGGGQGARDAFLAEMIELVGADRVFIVDVYSHGGEHFSIAGTANYPDRQWDVAPACVLAVPPDATNPREWAQGNLDEWNAWCAGDVWGIVSNYVKADGTVVADDSCWGFIGSDYAEEAAKSGCW